MNITPALPPPVGPNPAKARFFIEAAAAFELLGLFHSLQPEEQIEFRAFAAGLAAAATTRELGNKK